MTLMKMLYKYVNLTDRICNCEGTDGIILSYLATRSKSEFLLIESQDGKV